MHKLEHNVETGEVIEIPLTDKEIKEIEKRQAAEAKEQAVFEAAKAKAETEKAALLARLGLTEDELKTILG
jgi:membrane protein involved in colicin uptake